MPCVAQWLANWVSECASITASQWSDMYACNVCNVHKPVCCSVMIMGYVYRTANKITFFHSVIFCSTATEYYYTALMYTVNPFKICWFASKFCSCIPTPASLNSLWRVEPHLSAHWTGSAGVVLSRSSLPLMVAMEVATLEVDPWLSLRLHLQHQWQADLNTHGVLYSKHSIIYTPMCVWTS